jgi:hypothetical protein
MCDILICYETLTLKCDIYIDPFLNLFLFRDSGIQNFNSSKDFVALISNQKSFIV